MIEITEYFPLSDHGTLCGSFFLPIPTIRAAALLQRLQACAVTVSLLRAMRHPLSETVHTPETVDVVSNPEVSDEPSQIQGEHFREAGSNAEVDWEILGRVHHLSVIV